MSTKVCYTCKVDKPLSEYFASDLTYCKDCRRERGRAFKKKNREKLRYKARVYSYRKLYGLSEQEYQAHVTGVCDICKADVKLDLDHDHKTHKLRGKLCRRCNLGLGYFQDSVSNLQAAQEYLNFHGTQTH
jgi:hypothetical protein